MDSINEKRTEMVIEIINKIEKDTGKKIKDISIDIDEKGRAEFDMVSFFERNDKDPNKENE